MAYDLSTYAGRQQARDDATAAGRSVVVDASGIYDRSSGQTSSGNTSFGGGAGGGGGGGVAPGTLPQVLTGAQGAPYDNLSRAITAATGVTQAQLAESKRQFDATLEWQKQMWANQGLPQLVINQRAQALTEQKYQSDLALAQQSMALARQAQEFAQGIGAAGETGIYNGQPTLAAQQQVFGQHQALAQQGLSYLQAAAALQGPQNVFQQQNFLRGAQGNPDIPVFLRALQDNTRLPAFTAPGSTPPVPLSMGGLAGQLTGQGGTLGGNPNAALAAVQGISNAGAQKLAPGSLERLTPDELAALGSGLGAVGNTLPAFLTQYTNSRPQQSAMSGDMSLAA